jgi:Tol biopolymer transport system component
MISLPRRLALSYSLESRRDSVDQSFDGDRPSNAILPADIRAELDKIFASPGFFRSARMRRFLDFIVSSSLAPEGDSSAGLKESLIGVAVFDRDPSYDPKADPIVRVEARRLRSKLAEYYEGPGKDDPVLIELPKGAYIPVIRSRADRAAPLPAPPPAVEPKRKLLAIGALVLILAVAVSLVIERPRARLPLTAVPVTSYEGSEYGAAFSPDGKSIAYSWNGPTGDNFDIYTETVGSQRAHRLTSDPGRDFGARWSHDGRRIAFIRAMPGKSVAVVVVPAAGGNEAKVADSLATFDTEWRGLDWLPGDRSLLIVDRAGPRSPDAIFELDLSSGRKRQLTFPPPGQGDSSPKVSPRGREFVFVRDVGHGVSRVFVMSVEKNRTTPRLLEWPEFRAALSLDPEWTADGRRIVFASNRGGPFRLWQARVSGSQPELLASLGENVTQPSVSPVGGLAFTVAVLDTDIWRINLRAAAGGGTKPEPAVMSTRQEHRPQVSPDGGRIAFESDRGGSGQIWISAIDGSDARQLTDSNRGPAGSPRWSPDGRRIVFDSRTEGQPEIYDVLASGGATRRLTYNSAADVLPVYSADGRWIYFGSNRSGAFQIWRMPAAGGEAVQLTHGGGSACQPSPDGRFLYFTRNTELITSLWRMPVDGGEESPVIDSLLKRSFVVTPSGDEIVFLRSPGETANDHFIHATLCRMDLRTGKMRQLAALERPVIAGLSISPDGEYAFYTQVDREGSDLALARDFR